MTTHNPIIRIISAVVMCAFAFTSICWAAPVSDVLAPVRAAERGQAQVYVDGLDRHVQEDIFRMAEEAYREDAIESRIDSGTIHRYARCRQISDKLHRKLGGLGYTTEMHYKEIDRFTHWFVLLKIDNTVWLADATWQQFVNFKKWNPSRKVLIVKAFDIGHEFDENGFEGQLLAAGLPYTIWWKDPVRFACEELFAAAEFPVSGVEKQEAASQVSLEELREKGIPLYCVDEKPMFFFVHIPQQHTQEARRFFRRRKKEFHPQVVELVNRDHGQKLRFSKPVYSALGNVSKETLGELMGSQKVCMLGGQRVKCCLGSLLVSCAKYGPDYRTDDIEIHLVRDISWPESDWRKLKASAANNNWILDYMKGEGLWLDTPGRNNFATLHNGVLLAHKRNDDSLPWITVFVWDDYEAYEGFKDSCRASAAKPAADKQPQLARIGPLDRIISRLRPGQRGAALLPGGDNRAEKSTTARNEWHNERIDFDAEALALKIRNNHPAIFEFADAIEAATDGKVKAINLRAFSVEEFISALKYDERVLCATDLSWKVFEKAMLEFHFYMDESNNRVRGTYGYSSEEGAAKVKRIIQRMFSRRNAAKITSDPVAYAAKVFVDIVKAQAFHEGNHRVADFALNFILAKNGYGHFVLTKANVTDYYCLLNTGDLFDNNYDLKQIIDFFRGQVGLSSGLSGQPPGPPRPSRAAEESL